jgi:hypothetical protein
MLGAVGRALLSATQALEHGADVAPASTRDLTLAANVLGGWTVRLLFGLLILASAICAVDLLARARRRRISLARWFAWVLAWGLPFLLAGLYAKLLAWSGWLAHVPPAPVAPAEYPFRGGDAPALISVLAVFALACLARVRLIKGPSLDEGAGETAGAPVALLCLASLLAAALWLANPYTAALLALPLLVWVPVDRGRGLSLARALDCSGSCCRSRRSVSCSRSRPTRSASVRSASPGPGCSSSRAARSEPARCSRFSLAGAVALAAAFVLMHPSTRGTPDDIQITVRGPATYAGPGSLGGTDSALRRAR